MTIYDPLRKKEVALTPEEKEALGNNTIYNFTLSQNDNNVTKFDGIVTVSNGFNKRVSDSSSELSSQK